MDLVENVQDLRVIQPNVCFLRTKLCQWASQLKSRPRTFAGLHFTGDKSPTLRSVLARCRADSTVVSRYGRAGQYLFSLWFVFYRLLSSFRLPQFSEVKLFWHSACCLALSDFSPPSLKTRFYAVLNTVSKACELKEQLSCETRLLAFPKISQVIQARTQC